LHSAGRCRKARIECWPCLRKWRLDVGAIVLLGLLPWVEPASAQKTYWLTVNIHEQLRPKLTPEFIEEILNDMRSRVMKNKTSAWVNDCDVTFKLKEVKTFASPSPDIHGADDLERVHKLPGDIKVVRTIRYCVGKKQRDGVIGCSWRANGRQKTAIVTLRTAKHHLLWAHELGHTTCLPHRNDDNFALMTPCPITGINWHISHNECRHFLRGPRVCPLKDPVVLCPAPERGVPLKRGSRQD
jgi:hypothetical protein